MTIPEGSLAARAAAWRDADPDPQTRAELDQLLAGADTAAVAERFRWSVVLGPLTSFCAAPRRAPDEPDWPHLGAPPPAAEAEEAVSTGFHLDLDRVAHLYRQGGGRAVVGAVGRRLRLLLGRR